MRHFARLLLTASLMAPSTAWAQDGSTSVSSDIVVTALRRETKAQDTPLALTAISGADLERAGVTDLTAMPTVPGLSFVDGGPSNTRLVIRGVQTVGEPTVGLYYDDVPVTGIVGPQNDAGGTAPRLKLFDVERVEVLRGPQGTLFGAGSMGGTVQVIFRKPSDSFAAAIDAGGSWTNGGGFNHRVNAMVNAPVVAGLLAVRLVGYDELNEGYIDNPVLGQKNFNREHAYGGRLLGRLTLAPQLTVDGAVHYQHSSGDRPIWNLEAGAYQALNQSRLPSPEETAIYSLSAHWDGGNIEGTATGSIMHRRYDQGISDPSYYFQGLIDNPATCKKLRGRGNPCTLTMQSDFNDYVRGYVHGIIIGFQRATTHTGELRFSSKGAGWLAWTVGGFVSDRTAQDDNNQVKTDPVTGVVLRPYVRQTERLIDDKLTQYAGYGEIAVTPVDRLTATAGLRYFRYERETAGNVVIPLDLIGAVASSYTRFSSTDDGVVLKGNLAFRPNADMLIYVQAAQGFRPGGANQSLGLPPELESFRPDSLWTYEFGLKSSWLDRRITFDLAIYRTDWSDMQVTGQRADLPFAFISNAGAARIQGVEAELAFHPLPGLDLHGSAAYNDAVLTQDQKNANITANGSKGNRVPFVPRFTVGGTASYGWQVSAGARANLRLDISHVGPSASEFNPANAFYRLLPGYTLTNLHAGVDLEGGWSAELFADNLFDEVAISWLQTNGVTAGKTLVAGARPRTLGVSLGKNF